MHQDRIFESIYEQMTGERRKFFVEFYPYASLKHTIRERNGSVFVRLSDACSDAPQEILEAIAAILISKLRRRKIAQEHWETYRNFMASDAMRRRHKELRRKRGHRVLNGSSGKCYNLEEIFERLNKSYFNGELKKPELSWSAKKARSVLGQHDAALNAIVISRVLDDARVPNYALEYIMYHEMLHMRHEVASENGRRKVHSMAFKGDEKKFERYEEARAWMKRGLGKR